MHNQLYPRRHHCNSCLRKCSHWIQRRCWKDVYDSRGFNNNNSVRAESYNDNFETFISHLFAASSWEFRWERTFCINQKWKEDQSYFEIYNFKSGCHNNVELVFLLHCNLYLQFLRHWSRNALDYCDSSTRNRVIFFKYLLINDKSLEFSF